MPFYERLHDGETIGGMVTVEFLRDGPISPLWTLLYAVEKACRQHGYAPIGRLETRGERYNGEPHITRIIWRLQGIPRSQP